VHILENVNKTLKTVKVNFL